VTLAAVCFLGLLLTLSFWRITVLEDRLYRWQAFRRELLKPCEICGEPVHIGCGCIDVTFSEADHALVTMLTPFAPSNPSNDPPLPREDEGEPNPVELPVDPPKVDGPNETRPV
jgi:hypothetical protein